MITLARIINAFRDAEQFDFPVDARSFIWHALIIPQYAFSIFSMWLYTVIIYYRNIKLYLAWIILSIDVLFSWVAFEFFLNYFRN